MTTYSKPAKALAVLTFTSGVITDEKAVELFDLITQAENEDAIEAVLEEHDFSPWDEVGRMKLMDWSEEINTLAQNYDRLAKKMAEPVPAPVAYRYKYLNFMGNEVWSQDKPRNGKVLETQELYTSSPPPAEPAVEPVSDDLRDRLVAISAAIADQDDRAAQAMIREILSSPPPPAEPAPCTPRGWLVRIHQDGLIDINAPNPKPGESRRTCCVIRANDNSDLADIMRKYFSHALSKPSPLPPADPAVTNDVTKTS